MAKKSFKQKFGISKTRQQTHRFLYFDLSHTGNGEDFHYIDLAKHLSSMNRRLYRQGMCYHIANISIHDSQGNASVKFATAPNTWTTYAAWKYVFENWKAQRADILEDSAMSSPRWSDFKVYLNKDMVNDVDWPNPKNVEQQNIQGGQWDYADMSFSSTNTHYDSHAVGLLGGNSIGSSINPATSGDDPYYNGYISAIKILNDTRRSIPRDEKATADSYGDGRDSWSLISFDIAPANAKLDILNELEDEGLEPPYGWGLVGSDENPTAGDDALAVREAHIASTQSPMATVGGFPVPCGLMQIETKCTGNNTIGILIELVPGDYKGVHALPMGE